MDIKIYSMPTCPYCKMAKEYLSSKGISFRDIDVSADHDALEEMIKISGQMGVPVIVSGDKVVTGFDKSGIDSVISS
ncbi:MAG: glutaredoxin family protein [Candidatus Omnitrophica bacterium]|nr:glutaredoxin family protein [Candidatus Omnitrophota bacterium]